MPIYEFTQTQINNLEETTFNAFGFHERKDLQRLLREKVDVIATDILVVSEEFDDWDEARRASAIRNLGSHGTASPFRATLDAVCKQKVADAIRYQRRTDSGTPVAR